MRNYILIFACVVSAHADGQVDILWHEDVRLYSNTTEKSCAIRDAGMEELYAALGHPVRVKRVVLGIWHDNYYEMDFGGGSIIEYDSGNPYFFLARVDHCVKIRDQWTLCVGDDASILKELFADTKFAYLDHPAEAIIGFAFILNGEVAQSDEGIWFVINVNSGRITGIRELGTI